MGRPVNTSCRPAAGIVRVPSVGRLRRFDDRRRGGCLRKGKQKSKWKMAEKEVSDWLRSKFSTGKPSASCYHQLCRLRWENGHADLEGTGRSLALAVAMIVYMLITSHLPEKNIVK